MQPPLARLTQPLVRDRTPDGRRTPLRPASWEEALARAAAGLAASTQRHGP
jgi:anaerobic selenocysteine-containing dehydrogenase